MRERRIMTSFALANATDVLLTKFAIETLNHTEIGFGAETLNNNFNNMALAKTAITVGIIGVYALSHKLESNKIRWSTEKSMIIANYILWSIQVWNLINITAELAAK